MGSSIFILTHFYSFFEGFRSFRADMPPRAVKKTAGTAASKKAASKSPNKKTAQSIKKTPISKPEPEIVQNVDMVEQATPVKDTKPEPEIFQNVEMLEQATPVRDTKAPEVPVKEEKSIEDGKLKEPSPKDAAAAEEPALVIESAPKEGTIWGTL